MRRLISSRTLRRKKVWGVALMAAAALVATASLAFGQVAPPAPDGGPPVPPGPNPVTTQCGQSLTSTVVTDNTPLITNFAGFVPVPGMSVPLNLPAPRCVKVLFTAESSCGPTANPDFCYIQATVDGIPMDPNGAGFQALDSEDATAGARAYEWVKRVPAGNHVVQLQWRVLAAGTQYRLDERTFDVQVWQ